MVIFHVNGTKVEIKCNMIHNYWPRNALFTTHRIQDGTKKNILKILLNADVCDLHWFCSTLVYSMDCLRSNNGTVYCRELEVENDTCTFC